jgi:hypothetical protein
MKTELKSIVGRIVEWFNNVLRNIKVRLSKALSYIIAMIKTFRTDVTKKDTYNPIRKAGNLSVGNLDKLFNIGGESGMDGPLGKVMDFIPTASLGKFALVSTRSKWLWSELSWTIRHG